MPLRVGRGAPLRHRSNAPRLEPDQARKPDSRARLCIHPAAASFGRGPRSRPPTDATERMKPCVAPGAADQRATAEPAFNVCFSRQACGSLGSIAGIEAIDRAAADRLRAGDRVRPLPAGRRSQERPLKRGYTVRDALDAVESVGDPTDRHGSRSGTAIPTTGRCPAYSGNQSGSRPSPIAPDFISAPLALWRASSSRHSSNWERCESDRMSPHVPGSRK